LSKTGKCLDCPAGYIQDPQNPKDCLYGNYVKQVRCKRGYRVDQLSIENQAGVAKLSHAGFAGGAWRDGAQELTLASGEYIKAVDAYHITSGYVKDELAKIVYFTNKERIVQCYYDGVRYRTEKVSFKAPEGEFIKMINQYQDTRKCCGRVTSVDTEKFAKSKDEALSDAKAATCQPSQYLKVIGDARTCAACPKGQVRHSTDYAKCILACPEYTYISEDGASCKADTCSQFEKLGKTGKCEGCAIWKDAATRAAETAATAAAASTADKLVALKGARQSSTWPRPLAGAMLTADRAIDASTSTQSLTAMGRGHWWSASFTNGNVLVKSVKVRGTKLKDVTVHIGRYYCGKLPATTSDSVEYTVTCASAVMGNTVVLRQNTYYTALQLSSVSVYGDDNCSHNERANTRGPHRCSSGAECAGKRTCSRWGWCGGASGCSSTTSAFVNTRLAHSFAVAYQGQQCAAASMSVSLGKTTNAFANAAECAAVAKSELNCEFFNFDTSGGVAGSTAGDCKCCSAIDGRTAKSSASIYKITPNLPAYLKNIVDPKYCTFKCPEWYYARTSDDTCRQDTCTSKQRFGPDGRCHACNANMKQDPADNRTCIPDCAPYTWFRGTDFTCQKDKCTDTQKLGTDGHCADCAAGQITNPTDEKKCMVPNGVKEIQCTIGDHIKSLKFTSHAGDVKSSYDLKYQSLMAAGKKCTNSVVAAANVDFAACPSAVAGTAGACTTGSPYFMYNDSSKECKCCTTQPFAASGGTTDDAAWSIYTATPGSRRARYSQAHAAKTCPNGTAPTTTPSDA